MESGNMKVMDKALAYLKQAGAQEAQCSAYFGQIEELNAEQGGITLLRSLTGISQITMKAIIHHKMGAVTLSTGSEAALQEAAEQCVAMARAGKEDVDYGMNESGEVHQVDRPVSKPDMALAADRLKELNDCVAAQYPSVNIRSIVLRHNRGEKIYKNTYGTAIACPVGSYELFSMFLANEGEKTGSFNGIDFSFENLEEPLITMAGFREQIENVEKQLHTEPFGEKAVGALVISPQCLDGLLAQMLSAFMDGPSLIAGASRWRNSIGEQVADPSFSLFSAPLDKRIVNGECFTEDGFLTANEPVIQKGRLETLLPDLYTANKTGLKRANTAGGSLIVESGEKGLEEIIRSIDKGVLMYRFSGGVPQASGDFSGVAKNSFIIRNGRIAGALRETTISGNIGDMLQNIRGISRESICYGDSVMPYAAFDGITIS